MRRVRLISTLAVVALLAVAGVALASVLGDTGFYKGSTSQNCARPGLARKPCPFSFKLIQNGRRIERGRIAWRGDCQVVGANGYRDVTTFTAQVSRTGVFALSGGYTSDLGNGLKGQVTANMSGRFPRERRAVGTFRARVTVTDANGNVVDRCDSDRVNWHAKHI